MKQELAKMTDELDLLVAEEEDKVRERNQKIADDIDSKKDSALETIQAKIDAIDEDIQTRAALIKADAQRNIDLMIAAAERKKQQLNDKRMATAISFGLKLETIKTVPKTGKILALEKKIRAKEEVTTKAQQFLEFCKLHDTCSVKPQTREDLLAATRRPPRTDWSKMPNGEPYPDIPWLRDGGVRQEGGEDNRRDPGCPYSPTEMAYRAAALGQAPAQPQDS